MKGGTNRVTEGAAPCRHPGEHMSTEMRHVVYLLLRCLGCCTWSLPIPDACSCRPQVKMVNVGKQTQNLITAPPHLLEQYERSQAVLRGALPPGPSTQEEAAPGAAAGVGAADMARMLQPRPQTPGMPWHLCGSKGAASVIEEGCVQEAWDGVGSLCSFSLLLVWGISSTLACR